MITIITAATASQFAQQRNAALKHGLPFEPIAALRAEVTFQNPDKVLGIIQEAGGRISRPLHMREMTRKEML